MKLTFRLRYHTRFGQSLWLSVKPPLLGGGETERRTPTRREAGQNPLAGPEAGASPEEMEKAIPLQYLNEEFWQATVEWPDAAAKDRISYDYILRNPDGTQVADWGRERVLVPAAFNCEELAVMDAWNDASAPENAFYTEPFQRVLLAGNFTEVRAPAPAKPTHTFRVRAPLLGKHQTLCLVGDGAALGNWDTARPLLLNRPAGETDLSVQLDLRGQTLPLAYKYGVFDAESRSFVCYEEGPNRVLQDFVASAKHTLVNDGFVRLPAETWRGAGVAIPLFSLRSENSFGIGEFADLKPLADWAAEAGLKLIQILPVNDTTATHTWTDSYPYAAISAFALHPIYLNLAAVANAKNQKLLAGLEPERRRLNALDALDYVAVMKAKLGFLKRIYPSQKAATFRSRAYRTFFAENERWLVPYAAFCFLRDRFGTPDFHRWPEHQTFDVEKIAALARGNDEIAFHCFVQFHLHQQLQAATAHAHARGVVVKGDIAIGVSCHGVGVWHEPELFHTDMQAGAPPDPFSAKGQNWSFPTYNWRRMEAHGFAWWKHRFAQMGRYFDAFRIDHILGFFRIWSVPVDAVEGILGHFVPVIPVDPTEFAARGITFDHERFTRPFITDAVLRDIFENDTGIIHREYLTASPGGIYSLKPHYRNFLDTNPSGLYSLKPQFATQRQVEGHFATRPEYPRNAKLKQGLFDLISNVILLEADGKLHFRFFMEQTTSFKYLPPDTQAKLKELYVDYFFRRQDDFWKAEAMRKLPALKRVTNMLICGEDLGLVPACVPGVMKGLGLLGLEIQRMPKRLGQEFSRPADAPYLSVVSPGSHDMSTIRGWWEEDRAVTQKFFNRELGHSGEAPREAGPEIVQTVVRQHLASPAMWSIFQLQDLLGMDAKLRRADMLAERINVPAQPNFYWRYRMHLTLEQLRQATAFNERLRALIRQSGR